MASRADSLFEAMLGRIDRWLERSMAEAEEEADVRRAARRIFFRSHPNLRGRVQVHHRIPLEWSKRLFPRLGRNPNRPSNLQGLSVRAHRYKASALWDAFRAAYLRQGRQPTPQEVRDYANLVDRSLRLPFWLPAPSY
jgi:hypothetical protein